MKTLQGDTHTVRERERQRETEREKEREREPCKDADISIYLLNTKWDSYYWETYFYALAYIANICLLY